MMPSFVVIIAIAVALSLLWVLIQVWFSIAYFKARSQSTPTPGRLLIMYGMSIASAFCGPCAPLLALGTLFWAIREHFGMRTLPTLTRTSQLTVYVTLCNVLLILTLSVVLGAFVFMRVQSH